MNIKGFLFGVILFLCPCLAMAQTMRKNGAYEEYIHKYKAVAVEEMKLYHIPASITLAQGLLESGAGRSELARKSNNHFGIKCGGSWNGSSVRHDDDARNECFRAYRHAKESYRDHSKFLRSGARYSFLFRLPITDYKGWARGLKKAGYATDPQYANRLIGIIELYGLNKYDKKGSLEWENQYPNPHQPYLANGLLYVIARPGDTFKTLGKELKISYRKIRKYNELPKDYTFRGGEIVYLEKKNRKATKEHIVYVVREGDSMYGISQKFGIRLDRLYKLNKMNPESVAPQVGDILRLR